MKFTNAHMGVVSNIHVADLQSEYQSSVKNVMRFDALM